MKNKAVFPGQYLQGQGTLHELPELVKLFGNKGLIIASPTVMETMIMTDAFGRKRRFE